VHVQGFLWQRGNSLQGQSVNQQYGVSGRISGDNAQTAHSRLGGHVEQFQTHSKATAPRHNICDFFLFPKTNIQLKGHRYKDTAEIPAESLRRWTAPRNGSSRDDSRTGAGAGSIVGTPKGTVPTSTLRKPGTVLLPR
jgi:hypothetical protein